MLPYRIEPVEWEVRYPVHVEPIGKIRRRRDGFHAKLHDEYLGVFPDGDGAVVAVWERFLEESRVRYEHASVTHGGRDRHA